MPGTAHTGTACAVTTTDCTCPTHSQSTTHRYTSARCSTSPAPEAPRPPRSPALMAQRCLIAITNNAVTYKTTSTITISINYRVSEITRIVLILGTIIALLLLWLCSFQIHEMKSEEYHLNDKFIIHERSWLNLNLAMSPNQHTTSHRNARPPNLFQSQSELPVDSMFAAHLRFRCG